MPPPSAPISAPISAPATLRALLSGLVDYAGLFPPAELPMRDAVAHYATYRAHPDAWTLGRFVVPVSRLDELVACAAELLPADGEEPWHLSVLGGADPVADAARVAQFGRTHAGRVVVDAVEARAASADDVARLAAAWPAPLALYVELPLDPDPAPLVRVVHALGRRAKMRTGGVTASAIPAPALVARFIAQCTVAGVPFKATAGLHHPVRGDHRLTYHADSPTATMHGFLNVWMAAALVHERLHHLRAADSNADAVHAAVALATDVLSDTDPASFGFDAAAARWRDHRVSLATLDAVRDGGAIAFGSCSFREPLDDLRVLALL